MAFDFTKLIQDEQKKQEETSSRSGGVGFKTVYPYNNGRLELKLIGNEPSGLLYREVMFHQYYSDGKNVIFDFSQKEYEIAVWLSKTFNESVIINPRINNPEGIKTSDYIFQNHNWK